MTTQPSPAPIAASPVPSSAAPCARTFLDATLFAPDPHGPVPIAGVVDRAFGIVVPLEAEPGAKIWFLAKPLEGSVALVGTAKRGSTEQLWLFKALAPGSATIRLDYGVPNTRGPVTSATFDATVVAAPC